MRQGHLDFAGNAGNVDIFAFLGSLRYGATIYVRKCVNQDEKL